MGNVDSDPPATKLLRRMDGGAAAAERVEHDAVFGTGCGDDPLEQREGFLGRVAEPLLRL